MLSVLIPKGPKPVASFSFVVHAHTSLNSRMALAPIFDFSEGNTATPPKIHDEQNVFSKCRICVNLTNVLSEDCRAIAFDPVEILHLRVYVCFG